MVDPGERCGGRVGASNTGRRAILCDNVLTKNLVYRDGRQSLGSDKLSSIHTKKTNKWYIKPLSVPSIVFVPNNCEKENLETNQPVLPRDIRVLITPSVSISVSIDALEGTHLFQLICLDRVMLILTLENGSQIHSKHQRQHHRSRWRWRLVWTHLKWYSKENDCMNLTVSHSFGSAHSLEDKGETAHISVYLGRPQQKRSVTVVNSTNTSIFASYWCRNLAKSPNRTDFYK